MIDQPLLQFRSEPVSRADEMFDRFVKYHLSHPEVWCLFLRLVYSELAKGVTHYSARSILHRIRWDEQLTAGAEYKMPHEHSPWYARMWAASHPDHAGIFTYRRLPSAENPPVGEAGPHDPDNLSPDLTETMQRRLRELAKGDR